MNKKILSKEAEPALNCGPVLSVNLRLDKKGEKIVSGFWLADIRRARRVLKDIAEEAKKQELQENTEAISDLKF